MQLKCLFLLTVFISMKVLRSGAVSRGASYLVIVIMSVEERFFPEDHAGKHAAQTPHIKGVVVHLHQTQPQYIS